MKDLELRQNLRSLGKIKEVRVVLVGQSIPSSVVVGGAFWAPNRPLRYSAIVSVRYKTATRTLERM